MTPAAPAAFDTALIWLFAGWAVLGIGALLLLWALFRDRSRGRRRCPQCWYDMTGVPGLRCPECGREPKREKKFFKTRRRWGWAAVALLLVCTGTVSTRVPRALKHGWLDAVPVVLLRPALWWERERARDLCNQLLESRWPGRWSGRTASVLTQWERMLVADEAALRIEQGPHRNATTPSRWIEEDALFWQFLTQMGREARVAESSLRRCWQSHISGVRGALAQMTICDAIDFRHELTEMSQDLRALDRSADALDALLAVGLATGRPSPEEIMELLLPQDDDAITMTMYRCGSAGSSSTYAKTLAGAMLGNSDAEVRRAALRGFGQWRGAPDWAQPHLAPLWDQDPSTETFLVICSLAERFESGRDEWGLRIVRACEHPEPIVQSAALGTLASWIIGDEHAAGRLRVWLAELDRLEPRESRLPRNVEDWIPERSLVNHASNPEARARLLRWSLTPSEFARLIIDLRPRRDGEEFRRIATAMLGTALGPDDSAVFATRMMREEPSGSVRATLLDSVVKPFASHAAMRPVILAALDDSSVPVLVNACLAAGSMGRVDEEVIARLRTLAADEIRPIKRVAETSLTTLLNTAATEPVPQP